jgi:hypothetical protein
MRLPTRPGPESSARPVGPKTPPMSGNPFGDGVASGPIRFTSSGYLWLPPCDVQAPLARFVNATLGRLEEAGIDGTLLQEEWAAIIDADVDETAFCDAAAALGLDPYDVSQSAADSINSIGAMLDAALASTGRESARPDRRRLTQGVRPVGARCFVLAASVRVKHSSNGPSAHVDPQPRFWTDEHPNGWWARSPTPVVRGPPGAIIQLAVVEAGEIAGLRRYGRARMRMNRHRVGR